MSETTTVEVKIEGMTCGSCVYKIECEVGDLEGIQNAKVNLETKLGNFQLSSNGPTKPEDVVNKINELGFKAQLV